MSDERMVTMTSYLLESEKEPVWQKLWELGYPVSQSKVIRALMVKWSRGQIPLSREEILQITPDARLNR